MPTDQDYADALQDRFLRITRSTHASQSRIHSGDMFDMTKIYKILENAGRDRPDIPVITRDAACESITEIAPAAPQRTMTSPEPQDHYIYAAPPRVSIPAWTLFEIQDCYLSFDLTRPWLPEFYILNQDRAIINGLFFGANPFLEDPIMEVAHPCVFADDFFVKFNICHLIFDKLPRARLAHTVSGVDQMFLFSVNDYVRDLAEILGMSAVGLPPETRRGTIKFKKMVCLSDSFGPLVHPARFGATSHVETMETLRQKVLAGSPAKDAPSRFFLRRAADLPRGIDNAKTTETLLLQHGFVLGDPGDLTPRAQMELFLGVDTLIGVHGAGLTNMVYMGPGSTVVELVPPMVATQSYWPIAQALGHDYRHLVCDDPEFGVVDALNRHHDASFNRRNVIVPEGRFEALLRDLPR